MPTHSAPCGLDFGTSNSTLAVPTGDGPALVPLEGEHVTLPSAMFFGFDAEHAFLVGRAGVTAYIDGVQGRLLRSLKSILGSSLIDEKTPVFRKRMAFSEIIGRYLAEVKRRAEVRLGHPIDQVVMGRPVHFVNDDPVGDRHAEDSLRKIAHGIGFREVSFQYEPVAAALDYERQITRETLVLVADIGGGTSDFTIVRLSPQQHGQRERASDLLANGGIRLGGTDFDTSLSMAAFMPLLGHGTPQKRQELEVPARPYWDLSTWSAVHLLYEPKRILELRSIRQAALYPEHIDRLLRIIDHRRAHSLLIAVEAAKIALSDAERATAALDWIEPGLAVDCTEEGFRQATRRLHERLRTTVLSCAQAAGIRIDQLDAIYFTGGTSQIPDVRATIASCFPESAIVDGDRFGSVGLGLAVEAQRRYG
ncbi:MAG: Hsp70 family protein [Proteobacteria bacterium]|nr:Hsp70 family protein [Pseudomonadota bacterium]